MLAPLGINLLQALPARQRPAAQALPQRPAYAMLGDIEIVHERAEPAHRRRQPLVPKQIYTDLYRFSGFQAPGSDADAVDVALPQVVLLPHILPGLVKHNRAASLHGPAVVDAAGVQHLKRLQDSTNWVVAQPNKEEGCVSISRAEVTDMDGVQPSNLN